MVAKRTPWMQGENIKMKVTQNILGCSVIVAVVIAGTISYGIVNREIPDAKSRIAPGSETGDRPEGRGICFTIDGKRFEWRFANIPFGALRCSQ